MFDITSTYISVSRSKSATGCDTVTVMAVDDRFNVCQQLTDIPQQEGEYEMIYVMMPKATNFSNLP